MYNKPYGQLMNAIRTDQTIKKPGITKYANSSYKTHESIYFQL